MPAWLAILASRVAGLLTGRRQDEELDLEVAAHLDMLTDDNVRRGLAPDEALRQAVLRFGGPVQIKERQRENRGLPFVETTLQDIRYGMRALRKSPASQRSRELGIRVALGAKPGALFRMVVGQGMRPVAIGAAVGLAGAVGITTLMQSLLFGVTPVDPAAYLAATAVLGAIAVAACALPALRATRVDPLTALRDE